MRFLNFCKKTVKLICKSFCFLICFFALTGCDENIKSDDVRVYDSVSVDENDMNLEKNSGNQEILFENYYNVEYDSDSVVQYNNWISLLTEFDEYSNSCGLTQFDKMNYIRGGKYNNIYWGELLAYDDENIYSQITSYKPEFDDLRNETIICLPNTDIRLKTVHMTASLQCMKDGIGSFGSWKGDLVELARDIDKNNELTTYDEIYDFAYKSISSTDSSSCNLIDIMSDVTAVNIGMNMTKDEDLSKAISEYASYIQYFNHYAVFIKNEFGVSDIDKDTLRYNVKSNMDSDMLVLYLMKSFDLYDSDTLYVVCDAFADFLYNSLEGHTVSELTAGLEMFQSSYKQKLVRNEFKIAQTEKYKAMFEKYLLDANLAELFDKLSE